MAASNGLAATSSASFGIGSARSELLDDRGGQRLVLLGQLARDIERMAACRGSSRDLLDGTVDETAASPASDCCGVTALLGQAQTLPIGIEPKPRPRRPSRVSTSIVDVDQHRVGDDAAAELDRRAIVDPLGVGADVRRCECRSAFAFGEYGAGSQPTQPALQECGHAECGMGGWFSRTPHSEIRTPHSPHASIPLLTAHTAACVRSATPIFFSKCCTCSFTVS